MLAVFTGKKSSGKLVILLTRAEVLPLRKLSNMFKGRKFRTDRWLATCAPTAIPLRPTLQVWSQYPCGVPDGERVLIVGGGLTSGHLALGAVSRGARVTLMARRDFQEKLFDADPGWLGPKYLKGFAAESDWQKRFALIQEARKGSSLTPAVMLQLRRTARKGQVELKDNCEVVKVCWKGSFWQVICTNGEVLEFERIWLATGTRFDVNQIPLLTEVMDKYPTLVVNGLPVLDQHLRWPSCELLIMGGLAALQVGPVARNLFGAKMACDRIVPALTKASLALAR
ncbi:MAG: hypothetical protein WA919_09945, partial [Coleofasciculaceae cyanobacterium]